MVQQQDVEEEFDLEKIDTEMRLEKIRQSASKLTWEEFTGALHRNLKEKKYVLDADGRLDLLQAIVYMKKNLPVDENSDINGRLKQLADSLECSLDFSMGSYKLKNNDIYIELEYENNKLQTCKIGYFGLPPQESIEGCNFLNDGDYNAFRSAVFSMLSIVPNFGNNLDHKKNCSNALELLEAYLSFNTGSPSFDAINNLPYGCFRPRSALHPGRIYYSAEPCYMKATERSLLHDADFNNLPCVEVSIVQHDKTIEMPAGNIQNPWSAVVKVPACVCLKFSVPIIFCQSTWQKIEKYLARSSIAKQHVNIYRHTSRYDFKDSHLVLRSSLPENLTQHCYIVNSELLKDETDVVISELYIADTRNLDKIISLIRSQQMHNSLWESILSMCVGKWRGGEVTKMKVFPAAYRIEIQYMGQNGLILVRFEQNREFKWSAKVFEGSDTKSASEEIDGFVTEMLLKSNSIPCAMTRVLSSFPSRSTYDPAAATFDSSVVIEKMDKVGDAWLTVKRIQPPQPKFVYDVEEDPNPGALLASFKEVEIVVEQTPTRPEAMSRVMRHQSETSYAHAYDDMAAIFQIADAVEDREMGASTPGVTNRHESSPAPRSAGGITQLSPLEAARQRMAHSVGAATAVGLANVPAQLSSDVFDFPDDRSMSSQFPSPSGHTNFQYPAMTSPLSSQMRGGFPQATKTRRPRARKAANFGDRTPSTDSILGIGTGTTDPFGMAQRRPRGKAPVRRPRGSRKNSGLTTTHAEMDQRPTLQRSYSEYSAGMGGPMYPYPSPTMDGSDKSNQLLMEEESDDEHCDPPPPPKNLVSTPTGHAPAPYLPGPNPNSMHASSPAFHATPSPLMAAVSPAFQASPSPLGASPLSDMHKGPGKLTRRDTTDTPPTPSPLAPSTPLQSSGLGSLSMPSGLTTATPLTPTPIPSAIPLTAPMSSNPIQKSKPPPSRTLVSDLYDDGGDSPPPPEERIPAAILGTSSISSTSSSHIVTTVSSPREHNDSPTATSQIKSESKLILKISKPARSSPSVDMPKQKSSYKSEKSEKKRRDKDKEKEREKDKDKDKDEYKRKRKAELSKERDKEAKRLKVAATPVPDKIPPILPFAPINSLKNFKIPKREENRDTPKESKDSSRDSNHHASSSSSGNGAVPPPPPPPPKGIMKKPHSMPPPHMNRGYMVGMPPGQRKPPIPMMDHGRRPPLISGPPSSIPLPKGPPPPRPQAGQWVRPPSSNMVNNPPIIPHHQNLPPPPRSPSPEQPKMQIEDPNSPEDSLRIADD